MKTITTIEQLEALPEGAILTASGRYPRGGTFTECAVRPVPSYITGTSDRLWQVLVFGAGMTESLVASEHIDLPATLLHSLIFTAEDVEKAAAMIHWESLDGTDRHPAEVEWQLLGEGERDIYRKLARAVLTNIGEVEA